jgi:PIN domain nuclease of toxin-antitoxin system
VRFLLDTHALIWWWLDAPQLREPGRDAIGSPANDIFVSAATVWEIATKWRIGKLQEIEDPEIQYAPLMARNGFISLPIDDTHTMRAGLLPGEHRDPFDRLIAAQALIENLTVITRDPAFTAFGCDVIW